MISITAINGSARSGKGITSKLLNAFIKGLQENSEIDVDIFNIGEKTISPCAACFYCFYNKPGNCFLKDDMEEIYTSLKKSSLFILATPVYTDTMSAQSKIVIDRCICCMEPFFTTDYEGRMRHTLSWKMPEKFLLLSTSTFPEPETFNPLKTTFRAQSKNLGSDLIAELCVPGSIVLQLDENMLQKACAYMYEAGEQLSANGQIEEELQVKINTPLFTKNKYSQIVKKIEIISRSKIEKQKNNMEVLSYE